MTMAQELSELRQKLELAKASNMGINVAKTRFLNGLYRYSDSLIAAAERVETIESEMAALREERDLFENTLARQDEELTRLRKASKGKPEQRS